MLLVKLQTDIKENEVSAKHMHSVSVSRCISINSKERLASKFCVIILALLMILWSSSATYLKVENFSMHIRLGNLYISTIIDVNIKFQHRVKVLN